MSVYVRDSLSGGMVEVGRDGKIGLYVCGPTVYDHVHVGNARAPLFWGGVVRELRGGGGAARGEERPVRLRAGGLRPRPRRERAGAAFLGCGGPVSAEPGLRRY